MIQPLRRVHRAAFLGLALFLPALGLGAWKVRREPLTQTLPPELVPGLAGDGADELVYWTATRRSEDLPGDAELIGTVRSGALEREPPPGRRVLVYDLAHARLVRSESRP